MVSGSLAAAFVVTLVATADAQLKLPRPSPKASVMQTVGLTDLTVTYSRPGVKDRVIWGELVPYDKPWRTGANEPTTFTTSDEIQFGGQKLAAGTYAIYTVPGKESWTLVLNKNTKDVVGSSSVKAEDDVLKLAVKPKSSDHQEWMWVGFEDLTPNSANLVLRWEKLALAVPITVNVNDRALANARAAIKDLKADDWLTPYQAASFTFNNDLAKDEGWTWLQKSLAAKETYPNLNLLARWKMKEGKKAEAIAAAKKAVAAGKASTDPVDTAPTEKLIAEWTGAK
jgi:hypothetical protein